MVSTKNYASEACKKIGADFARISTNADRVAVWNLMSMFDFVYSLSFFKFNDQIVHHLNNCQKSYTFTN